MYQTAYSELLKNIKITSTGTLTDISTATTPNKWTYLDDGSVTTTFYNNTGSAPVAGDRIILLNSQRYQLMKADAYAATYLSTEGGVANITSLTVSTGGTASNTLAAMTVTTPADLAAVAAQLVIIQNSIKSLGAKVNEILVANA